MRDKNRKVAITIVDDADEVIGSAPRNEALTEGVNHRTVHIIATFKGKILLQRLSQEHIRSPSLIGSSAAGFILKNEKPEKAAKRILKKELGVKTSFINFVGTIELNQGKAKKFVYIYWTTLKSHPESRPDEFSHLEEFDADEIQTLLNSDPDSFAKTFKPVFEFWSSLLQNITIKQESLSETQQPSSEAATSTINDCGTLLESYKIAVEEYRFQVNLT